MNQNKNNKNRSQTKLKITLDISEKKEIQTHPRLYQLFQGFKQMYSVKGAVKR